MAITLVFLLTCVNSQIYYEIPVWFNHLVPKNNPLMFYHPKKLFECMVKFKDDYYENTFAEDLEDLTMIDSGIQLNFLHNVDSQHFCRVYSDKSKIKRVADLIKKNTRVEIRLSDLVFWVPIGVYDPENNSFYLYSLYRFELFYNNMDLIEGKIEPLNPVDLETITKLDFSYSVEWKNTKNSLENRVVSYNIMKVKAYNIQMITLLFNMALTLVLGLTVFFWLKGNIQQNNESIDQNSGWASIALYINRPPMFVVLLNCFVSIGAHLGIASGFVLLFNIFLEVYKENGGFSVSVFWSYFLLSSISGFIFGIEQYKYKCKSNALYLAVNNTSLNAVLFMLFVMKAHATDHLINFASFIIVIGVYCFINTPLYIIGNFLGRFYAKKYITRHVFGESKDLPNPLSANIKVSYIVTGSLWSFSLFLPIIDSVIKAKTNFFIYSSYEFLFSSFVVFLSSVGIISLLITFLIVNKSDIHWHWNSFASGSFVGVYAFAYSIFVFYRKLSINEIESIVYYFAYTGLASCVLSLISGSFAYLSANLFIQRLYLNTKLE